MKNLYSRHKNISSEEFIALALAGEREAAEILQQAGVYLGLTVANLFTLYDPEFILIDGKAIVRLPEFFAAIEQNAKNFSDVEFNLLQAVYRKDAAAIGAAMLTIDKQLENILFSEK